MTDDLFKRKVDRKQQIEQILKNLAVPSIDTEGLRVSREQHCYTVTASGEFKGRFSNRQAAIRTGHHLFFHEHQSNVIVQTPFGEFRDHDLVVEFTEIEQGEREVA